MEIGYGLYKRMGFEEVMILANLGQRSRNIRTAFLYYPDKKHCPRRTSWHLKLLLYHQTAMPSSAGGRCSTEGRLEGPFKSKRYAFLTKRSRIASAIV